MRCLLVFEPADGGVPEHVARLALGLPEYGFEPVVAGPVDAIAYRALHEASVPVIRLPLGRDYRHPAHEASAARRLIALLRGRRIELVHAHSTKAGVLARVAALATGTPVVYTPHCFAFVGAVGAMRRITAVNVERVLGAATDAIICVAHEERRLALRHGIAAPDRLHVVHNASGPCRADLTPDPALKAFAAEGPLAATMCVLRPQKAVHVLLEAAPLVLDRLPQARLAVVGNGPLRPALEAHALSLGLDERVRFFDFASPPARQLRCMDVFVLPSAWEAFPISLVEAMACGVPQVATDVGGTREALVDGETGLLTPPGDPPALAERIVTLLLDRALRDRMAHAARERQARVFSLPAMLAATADVYRAAPLAR